MKKLSVNDLHKSLKSSLGNEFTMNELDFANELSSNKDYRDFVFNQIIPAIDSEFTPDLAREIEADLKKKDSQNASTFGVGESVETTSLDVDPPNKKKLAQYYSWQNKPYFGARTPQQYMTRKNKVSSLEEELSIFETGFINSIPPSEFGVIDVWENTFGNKYLGEFYDSPTSRDDMIARGVMEEKAINRGLSYLSLYERTQYPDGIPNVVQQGLALNRAVNDRAYKIDMHTRITDYLEGSSSEDIESLLRDANVRDQEGLNAFYEQNATELAEMDDMFAIEIAQPLPEVDLRKDYDDVSQIDVPAPIGFSGDISTALEKLNEITSTDEYKDYMKIEQSRQYFLGKLDEMSLTYPEYAEKIAQDMVLQARTDAQAKALDEASAVYKMPLRGAKVVSRTVLTLLHGIFTLPKSVQTMMGGVTNDETDAFLDFFDPDNNTFTRQASYAKRRQFEYLLDLGNGYTAVYDATLEDEGTLQYVVDSSGYMVHDAMMMQGLVDIANDKIENGEVPVYDYNKTSLATQSAQALSDVYALVFGGEVAAMSKGVTAASRQGLRLSNFVRGGLSLSKRPITAANLANRTRAIGSTATMYLQIHHNLYEQSIMNGMSAREAEYYAMGASAAIALVNRLNPEARFVRETMQVGKKATFNLQKGLTNRDVFGIGFKNTMRMAPIRAALEGVEERYLEPIGEKLVGDAMKYFNPNLQTINPDWANIFSLKDMDEFVVGAIVGGQMSISSGVKQYSSMPRVHQELLFQAYGEKEKTFRNLRSAVGMEFVDKEGNTRPVTEEDIEETIQRLEQNFQEFDEYIQEAELENKAFFSDEQKIEILQRINMKNAIEDTEENKVFREQDEAFLEAAKNDPSVIDASFTSPFSDAYENAKRTTNIKELDTEVNTLLGNRNPNADPKHITALAKVLEGNFKNVPVFVDKSAFRSFMVGIGIDEQALDNYRGVYDSASKSIFINPDTATLGTPIHEYSHIWVNYVAENNPQLFNKMKQLVEASPELMAAVGSDPMYQGKEAVEAMVIAIEKRAEEVVSDPNLLAKLKDAVKEFFAYLAKVFNVRTEDFSSMTLQEFVDTGAYEVLTGDFKVGGTIETLPAQSTTMNSNVGNMVSVLSTQGRVQGMLLKNQKGEYYVESPVGDIVVGQPTDSGRAIGDLGVLLAESESRIKIVNGINDAQRPERLIEIDGRLHVVVDDDLMRDNQGNAYGLTLQDKETGQEVFFSVDNEITQEIMRKSINAAYFSKVPETSEIFQLGIAPFRNRPINNKEDFEEALESPQFKFFEKTINDVASELNIDTIESFPALGGYEFSNGEYVNEISRVMQLQGPREDVELLGALMGILAPEQQESVMMLEVGDSMHNADIQYDPKLGFHVIPESVWSDTFDSRRSFMLEMLRQDFDSATGITGKTLNEELDDFELKYDYRPYFLDVTEEGQFVMSFPYSVDSLIDVMSKNNVVLDGFPFVNRSAVDDALLKGFNKIDNEAVELLSTINSAFSRLYNMGLPGNFELNFGPTYSAAIQRVEDTQPSNDLEGQPEEVIEDAQLRHRLALDMMSDIEDDADLQRVKIKYVLGYIAKNTIGTDEEIHRVFDHLTSSARINENQSVFGGNVSMPFGRNGRQRNYNKPLGLIIQMESTELQGVDKVKYITDFAKSVGIKGYSFDPNNDRLHIFVNNNKNAYDILFSLEGRWDVREINYARVKPRFKSETSTRASDETRSRVERGYYETIAAYRSKRPDLANERPNLHNALSIAEEAYVRDEAHRSDNRSMINAPIKIEWNDAKSDYMVGGMTMQQYGFRYGLTNFGGVRPRVSVNMGGGVYWEIPGGVGLADTFTYAELIWMKEQGWNPNDIKDEFLRTALYRKLARTHTQEGINRELAVPEGMTQEEYLLQNPQAAEDVVSVDPVDTFNRYIFGMLSPNQPLTPNEMQVAAMRVQGMQDEDSDSAIYKWFNGGIVGPLNMHGLPGDLYSEGFTYNISSVSMSGMEFVSNIVFTYTIKHQISDGTTHVQTHTDKAPWDALSDLFADDEGNRAIDPQRLKEYIKGERDITATFPANYHHRHLEKDAEYRWSEVAEGMRLYVFSNSANRTKEQDDIYNSFIDYADSHPWLGTMLDNINTSYSSMEYNTDANKEEKAALVEGYIENAKERFIRGYVASEYLSGLQFDPVETTSSYGEWLDKGALKAANDEQGRLNNKAIDPIFREDAGEVRTNLYMGVANISKGDATSTLTDGTKLGQGTRVFFHGTRFFFNKLDRVEEAKGAGTPTWNTTMKPSKGFTPFVSPSWSLANGFKGIGGEVLSIAVAADTKVFDPSRMGNVFGDLVRDENLASNSHTALSQQLYYDFESLARGEETVLPYDLVGAGLIMNYITQNATESFYERYFPKYIQEIREGDPTYIEFSYEYGVRRDKFNPDFFEDLSRDRDFLRRLAVDLLAEDFSMDDIDGTIERDFMEGATSNLVDNAQDAEVLDIDNMLISVYALPNYVFATRLYDYVLDGLDTEFANLVDRYQSRAIQWSDMARGTNYVSWTRNDYGYADGVKPIVETIALLMRFADNDFRLTEQPAIVDFFEEKGFDAFIVREHPRSTANLAVINPDKVNLKYSRNAPGVPLLRQTFTAQDVEKVTIQGLANMYPKDPSEPLTAEERKELADKMKRFFNMQKMDKGGLGLAGSADITNIARFAKMYMMNPDFFMKKKTETWVNFLERVQNQVPGLSSKTGAFSIVWQDPGTAAISAMDRHMFRIFEKELFSDPEVKARFDEMLLTKWNSQVEAAENAKDKAAHYKKKNVSVKVGAKRADNIDDVMAQYKFGNVNSMFMETAFALMGATNVKYRYADGEVNPSISFNLKNTKFLVEPKTVQSISENYMRMLAINEEKARQAGLSVFMSQWALWDKARNRFEPHAMMFPGLHKLPRMSFTNLKKARAGHRDAGYMNSSSISKFNEQLGEITKQMNPVKKAEPGSLLYFSAADPYRNIDMKQAKEIVGKYRRKGMSSDAIREAFIRGGMDRSVADALISIEFNPKDATIPEKVRLGFKNFAGNISQRTTDEIAEDSKKYLPRSNKITSADAYLMLEKMGLEQTYELLMNPTAMKDKRMQINNVDFADSEVRVVLTRLVAENFDKIANQMVVAGEPELEQQYRMYAANVLDNLLPELTQKGRFIQAASILAKSSGNYYISHINNRLRQQGMEPLSTDDAETLRRLHAKMKNAPEGLPTIEAETELMRFLSETLPVSLYEVLENQYYTGLLSGYGTNLKNVFGSLNQILFEGLTEAVASRSIKDFGAFWMGVGKGMVPALNIFRYIMATGVQYGFGSNAPGTVSGKYSDGKRTQPLPIYEYMSPNQFTGDNKFTSKYTGFWGNISTGIGRAMLTIFNPAIMKYFGRTLIGTDVAFSTIGQAAQVELIKERMKREHKFVDGMSPSKRAKKVAAMVMGVDKNREKRYEGYAKRAEKEGFKRGTPRHRIRVFELARAQELTEGMRQRMARKGQEYTYNYEPEGLLGLGYSWLISGLEKAKKANPVASYGAQGLKAVFVPFARILVNVANRGYAYSPLGLLKQSAGITPKLVGAGARKMESGSFKWTEVNEYERSLARARATIGTLVTAAIYGLTEGSDDDEDDTPWMTITGAGPSDYSKRYQLSMNRQYKPFTITINRDFKGDVIPRSERKSYEYRDSMVFLTLAAVGTIRDHERFGNAESESEAKRALATATTYGVAFLAAMSEQTYVQGLADLFKEVQPSGFSAAEKDLTTTTENLKKKTMEYLTTNAQNLLVPNIVRQVTRTGRGMSGRAIQQKVGSLENFDGYFKDLVRDVHMVDPDFPILDVFGRPVVPSYDNYLPVFVQPREEDTGVHLFFRENFLDNNIFIPKHKFPEYINEYGEGVPMTYQEEFMYFALRGAFIYDGLYNLSMNSDFFNDVEPNVEALQGEYPFADAETLETLAASKGKKNMKAELSRIVSAANANAKDYVQAVKFDLPLPETMVTTEVDADGNPVEKPFELPIYIQEAPYAEELFKLR